MRTTQKWVRPNHIASQEFEKFDLNIKKLSSFDTGRELQWMNKVIVSIVCSSQKERKVGVPNFQWISHEEDWAANLADQVPGICDRSRKQSHDCFLMLMSLVMTSL